MIAEVDAIATAYRKASGLGHRVAIDQIEIVPMDGVPGATPGEVAAIFSCAACGGLFSVELLDLLGVPVVDGPMLGSARPLDERDLGTFDDYADNLCVPRAEPPLN